MHDPNVIIRRGLTPHFPTDRYVKKSHRKNLRPPLQMASPSLCRNSAPHTGQSSQLVVDANNRCSVSSNSCEKRSNPVRASISSRGKPCGNGICLELLL